MWGYIAVCLLCAAWGALAVFQVLDLLDYTICKKPDREEG